MRDVKKHKLLLERIFKEYGVEFAYVFGSVANRNTVSESDIDLAVYLNGKRAADFFDRRLALIAEISRKLKKEADIVVLNTAPLFLKYVVLREGQLIFDGNLAVRVDFELKVMNDYSDYEPVLKMYHRRLLSA